MYLFSKDSAIIVKAYYGKNIIEICRFEKAMALQYKVDIIHINYHYH